MEIFFFFNKLQLKIITKKKLFYLVIVEYEFPLWKKNTITYIIFSYLSDVFEAMFGRDALSRFVSVRDMNGELIHVDCFWTFRDDARSEYYAYYGSGHGT